MKILFISKEEKVKRYTKNLSVLEKHDIYYAKGDSDQEIIASCPDTEILVADAIAPVSRNLIQGLPKLKMIHSEGVAFNSFDIQAAKEQQVYVCNNQGMNAKAVGEQTLLLMLGLLRDVVGGDKSVKAGSQIDTKMGYMVHGNLKELGECTIGLIGFGDIAKATALLLQPFGCKLFYTASHRHDAEEEAGYGVSYLSQEELLAQSDIVSLHLPVNEKTRHMADQVFFEKMKEGAYFINTSRGELVDNEALINALKSGKIAGAGLDTIETEPVQADNPLLLAKEIQDKLLLSPHIGGITAQSFARGYDMIWENVAKIAAGERPDRIVNGL